MSRWDGVCQCLDDYIILAIDVDAGNVTNVVDLRRANWSLPDRSIDEAGRLSLNGSRIGNDAVLNGIAWDETRNGFLISGKDWPETYLINDLANWTIGSAWDVSSPESDSKRHLVQQLLHADGAEPELGSCSSALECQRLACS